jgi:hypothetical protein
VIEIFFGKRKSTAKTGVVVDKLKFYSIFNSSNMETAISAQIART